MTKLTYLAAVVLPRLVLVAAALLIIVAASHQAAPLPVIHTVIAR